MLSVVGGSTAVNAAPASDTSEGKPPMKRWTTTLLAVTTLATGPMSRKDGR